VEIKEYLATNGRSPFRKWFNGLNAVAAAKVTVAVTRMAKGNLSNVESVGQGVLEFKISFGPGYRIYFGKDSEELIILLAGGTKKKQSEDIAAAQAFWADYKSRKKKES
jgi:putative addiction module killer protein